MNHPASGFSGTSNEEYKWKKKNQLSVRVYVGLHYADSIEGHRVVSVGLAGAFPVGGSQDSTTPQKITSKMSE